MQRCWTRLTPCSDAGHPSLAVAAPDVAAQLHPTRNEGLSAENLTCGSGRIVWWLCKDARCSPGCTAAHEWQARVADRVLRHSGCPLCARRRPCQCNSLKVLHPELVQQEWDYERNPPLLPEDCTEQSNKRVHWICHKHEHPHRWVANPNHRLGQQKTGCPLCRTSRLRKPALAAA